MELIKAIIVDDEIEGINALDFMLGVYCPNVKVIQKYQSSVDAVKNIQKEKPDLLFLDIKMPDIDGIELLNILGPENYNYIFTTAYGEFISKVLKMIDLDCLKKPICQEELVSAVKKVKPQGNISREQMLEARESIKNNEISLQTTIRIKDGHKIRFVKLAEICYCKSAGNLTDVFLSNGEKILASQPIKEIEERLPEEYFFRSHKQYIINGHHIRVFDRADGGSLTLLVNNNEKNIPISRIRREDFLLFLEKFL